MPRDQLDLFGEEPEPGPDYEPPVWYPDPDRVRVKLHRILARAASTMPWDDRRADLYRTIFPQMSRALPEEEAAQLCFEFGQEMERLSRAA
jgi:hypothetical protein